LEEASTQQDTYCILVSGINFKRQRFCANRRTIQKTDQSGNDFGNNGLCLQIGRNNTFVSKNKIEGQNVQPIRVDVHFVNSSDELNIEKFKAWREDFNTAEFIFDENGKYIVGREVEKMSKSYYNVVTPDDICTNMVLIHYVYTKCS
jgi:leucyl-tRNA synthetase